MANYLVSDVVDEFQRSYPQVNDTDALKLFKHVFIDVLARAEIENGTEDKNLTDGTREYELTYDPQILRVTCVYYIESATSAKRLTPVSIDWMDRNVDQWRTTTDTDIPSKYYIDNPTSAALTTQGKQVIGLDPIPDTTTSGGYPIIRIFGVEYEEVSATSDIPMGIPNIRVFVEGMKKIYASDRDPEKFAQFKSAYEDELADALNRLHNQDGSDGPIIRPSWMQTKKTV